jgi:hypothetical protein
MATDIYYTTKAGKTYKNGLLGFNCRHRLMPYMSGVKPEVIRKEVQQAQYAINQKQRALERQVRYCRLQAQLYSNVDKSSAAEAKLKAKALTAQYKAFCQENSRAFYPERLAIMGVGEQ